MARADRPAWGTDPDEGLGRSRTVAVAPDGRRYAVVTAPRGVQLRDSSGAGDLAGLVVELVVGVVLTVWGRDRPEQKVAVFAPDGRRRARRLFKRRVADAAAAEALVVELARRIEAGEAVE